MAKQNSYADGYGDAMRDVANKILDEGWDAGVKWVYDNLPDAELAKRLYDALRKH